MNFDCIKYALVDFDGTLLDSSGCWVETYTLLCKLMCVCPDSDTLRLFDELPFHEWKSRVFLQLGNCESALLECAERIYLKRRPKKLVLDIIASLPNDCEANVITREPKELVLAWLSHYGIIRFSDIINCGDERKSSYCYSKSNLLVIDDNYAHCSAAKEAGAVVIGVNDHHDHAWQLQMESICDIYIL